METKTIQFGKASLTFRQLTRPHLISAIGAGDPEIEALKPPAVTGYSHEDALANIKDYREKWETYESEKANYQVYAIVGLSHVMAIEMGDATKEEDEAYLQACKRMMIPPPDGERPAQWGAHIFAATRVVHGNVDLFMEVYGWVAEKSGIIVREEAVSAERKSQKRKGERKTAG